MDKRIGKVTGFEHSLPLNTKWLTTAVSVCPYTDDTAIDVDSAVNDIRALWDTGATTTIISQRLVDKLDLKKIAEEPITQIGRKSTVGVYYINLLLPCNTALNKMRVISLDINSHWDVILGVDVMKLGKFTVEGHRGEISVSWQSKIQDILKSSNKQDERVEDKIPDPCIGEKCGLCGTQAYHKVGEEPFEGDPGHYGHNLTQYVCRGCFRTIFQPYKNQTK